MFSLEMLRIIREYERWDGSLPAFVDHLRELGLRWGREHVTQLLHLAAARALLRRPPPKPSARGSSFRPPPGVQWTSDGKQVRVVIDGRTFEVAWQPMVDVGSTATVGTAVRANEDTQGVVAAFDEGVATTGDVPRALLVDNNLPVHTSVTVSFDLYILRTWDGNDRGFGPDIWDRHAGHEHDTMPVARLQQAPRIDPDRVGWRGLGWEQFGLGRVGHLPTIAGRPENRTGLGPHPPDPCRLCPRRQRQEVWNPAADNTHLSRPVANPPVAADNHENTQQNLQPFALVFAGSGPEVVFNQPVAAVQGAAVY